MKLIVAIINSEDSQAVLGELVRTGFSVTELSTSGAFSRAKNNTFLIGVENEKVSQAIEIISQFSSKRTLPVQKNTAASYMTEAFASGAPKGKITVGGATVFVLDAEQFYKL